MVNYRVFVYEVGFLLAELLLVYRMAARRSVAGISYGTQQILFINSIHRLAVSLCYENTTFFYCVRVPYILASLFVVACMWMHKDYRKTYNKKKDGFWHYPLYLVVLLIIFKFDMHKLFDESTAIYANSLAFLPQIYMLAKNRDTTIINGRYIALLLISTIFNLIITNQYFSPPSLRILASKFQALAYLGLAVAWRSARRSARRSEKQAASLDSWSDGEQEMESLN